MNPLRNLYRTMIKPHISSSLHHKLGNIYDSSTIIEIEKKFIRHKILQCAKILPRQDISDELLDVIDFLKNNPYTMIPYNFSAKYIERIVPTYYDPALEMVYIVENDKKMYFKRGITKEQALFNYNNLAVEQDDLSPHRYLTSEIHMMGTIPCSTTTSGFTISPGDVVVDLGVAEGNFAFSIVDIASKIYLFECDQEWVRALEATFRDYNDKVIIVSKYVSDIDDGNNISLDNYFDDTDVINFIKADIEGCEWRALQGMKKILKRNTDICAAICTYHDPTDAENFCEFLKKIDFDVKFTSGYILLNNQTPYLRKGVLRAAKKSTLSISHSS